MLGKLMRIAIFTVADFGTALSSLLKIHHNKDKKDTFFEISFLESVLSLAILICIVCQKQIS